MVKLSKLNPMVRAVGTVGAVAAIVGGITYAQIPTNSVTLQNNQLTTANASLGIAADLSCSDQGLGPVTGMSFNNLLPGKESQPFAFCVDNTGNVPLGVTVSTATDFTGSSLSPSLVKLHFTCGTGGADDAGAVNISPSVQDLKTAPVAFDGNLNNGTSNILSCDVTATVDSSVATANDALKSFNLDFNGSTLD